MGLIDFLEFLFLALIHFLGMLVYIYSHTTSLATNDGGTRSRLRQKILESGGLENFKLIVA